MASKRRLTRNKKRACDSHKAFPTAHAAIGAAYRLGTGMTPWKCDICHQFHIGHSPAHVRRAIENARA